MREELTFGYRQAVKLTPTITKYAYDIAWVEWLGTGPPATAWWY